MSKIITISREWGQKENYHLCINTSGKEVKKLISAIAAYSIQWFGGK